MLAPGRRGRAPGRPPGLGPNATPRRRKRRFPCSSARATLRRDGDAEGVRADEPRRAVLVEDVDLVDREARAGQQSRRPGGSGGSRRTGASARARGGAATAAPARRARGRARRSAVGRPASGRGAARAAPRRGRGSCTSSRSTARRRTCRRRTAATARRGPSAGPGRSSRRVACGRASSRRRRARWRRPGHRRRVEGDVEPRPEPDLDDLAREPVAHALPLRLARTSSRTGRRSCAGAPDRRTGPWRDPTPGSKPRVRSARRSAPPTRPTAGGRRRRPARPRCGRRASALRAAP